MQVFLPSSRPWLHKPLKHSLPYIVIASANLSHRHGKCLTCWLASLQLLALTSFWVINFLRQDPAMTSSNSPFSCLSVLAASFQRCEPAWPLVLTPNSSSILLLLLDSHSLHLIKWHPAQIRNSFQVSYSEDKFFSPCWFIPTAPPWLGILATVFLMLHCVLTQSLSLWETLSAAARRTLPLLQWHCVLQLRNIVRSKIRNQWWRRIMGWVTGGWREYKEW